MHSGFTTFLQTVSLLGEQQELSAIDVAGSNSLTVSRPLEALQHFLNNSSWQGVRAT